MFRFPFSASATSAFGALLLLFLFGDSAALGNERRTLFPREIAEFERVTTDLEVVSKIGSQQTLALPSEGMRVLIWNIHKAQGRSFNDDFARLALDSDLVLLQEAVASPQQEWFLDQETPHEWHMASSFFYGGGIATGVATGALARPYSTFFLRSPVREFYMGPSKMSLISEYRLLGALRRLLVINVHLLNFVDRYAFGANLSALDKIIRRHDGPVLLAGDFNSWSPLRMTMLQVLALRNGLKLVRPRQDRRLLKLDHVFVRELRVRKAEVLGEIRSSDHYPILVELSAMPRSGDLAPSH